MTAGTARPEQPGETYRRALVEAERVLATENASFGRIGLLRAAIFVAILAAAVVAVLSRGGPSVWVVGIGAIGFVAMVIVHERVARRRDRVTRSVGYLARGVARLEHRWFDGGDPGDRFRDDDHLYASDLELFGKGSLFHYLSTARTETGAATLAGWLRTPGALETIQARQAAVRELAARLDLRHDLAVVAGEVSGALDSDTLRRWLVAPAAGLPSWLGPVAGLLSVVNVVTTGIALAGWVPGYVILPGYFASLFVGLSVRGTVRRILAEVDRPTRELRTIAALVGRVAQEKFESPLLVRLLGPVAGALSGPVEIRRLERLVDAADARRNQLFAPVAALLLLGTQVAVAVERWRARMGEEARGWLAAIGELEALTSLATLAFEHPEDGYPTIDAPGAPIVLSGLAHPLLAADVAIRNDVTLGGDLRLLMISGSNMSGKSTLLKAIGSNLVLGFAGGPIRAASGRIGGWSLGASLVLRESLLEGRSRFFAEVLRLKNIVAEADRGVPVLFLLDELLSGTNSHDRVIGARGVLLGLVEKGAVGVVTTHDLALTEIVGELGSRGANWHLEDTLVDGQLTFDYRLKSGVVRRSNALELMKAVGLDVRRD